MPGFALNSIEVTTLFMLCGCAAAAIAIARRAYRAIAERNASRGLEAVFTASALLILATLFFNHQPPRRILNAAPAWNVRYQPVEAASREMLQRRAASSARESLEQERHAERERRACEQAERDELLEQMLAGHNRQ